MKLGLKLVTTVSSNLTNVEWELGNDVVDERNGADLIVTLIDFERSDAGGIINSSVLVTLDWLVVFAIECQELYFDLDLVARNLFLVSDSVDFAQPDAPWQRAYPITFADSINTCARDLDVMIAGEIPDHANRPEMASLAQIQNVLDNSRQCSIDWVLGNRLLVDQACLAFVFV